MSAPSWLDHPASHWPTFTALVRDESGLLEYLGRHPAQRNLVLLHGFTTAEIEAEGLDVLWRAYEWANEKGYPRKLALAFWPMWRSHCANLYRRRLPPVPTEEMDALREHVTATHSGWEADGLDGWLDSLPDDLRDQARLASQGDTPVEIMLTLEIDRSTYYRRRKRLAELLPEAIQPAVEQ